MKKFTIKVSYDAVAYIDVLAESEEQALKEMDLDMIPKDSIQLTARKWNVSGFEKCDLSLDEMRDKVNEYFAENYRENYYEFADYETIKHKNDEDYFTTEEIDSVSYDRFYEEISFEVESGDIPLSYLDKATQYDILKKLIDNLNL